MNEKLLVTFEVEAFPPSSNNHFDVFIAVESKHWYKRLFNLCDLYPVEIIELKTAQAEH